MVIATLLATIVALKIIEQIPRAARLQPFSNRRIRMRVFDSPFRIKKTRRR